MIYIYVYIGVKLMGTFNIHIHRWEQKLGTKYMFTSINNIYVYIFIHIYYIYVIKVRIKI